MTLLIRDPRQTWIDPLIDAADRRKIETGIIESPKDIGPDDICFIRPHANPLTLPYDQELYRQMTKPIQDWRQVMFYEYKRAQVLEWRDWMPDTWMFSNIEDALLFADRHDDYPLVSKADVGASSENVRIIDSRERLQEHIMQIFYGGGIKVQHCSSDGAWSMQRDYMLLQRFIPHDTTYRVNRIGNEYAIFLRHNYPDRPVAQTGNTDVVCELTPELEDLLAYSERFTDQAKTHWVCLDILRDGDNWVLLETSLCWPWPGVGDGSLFWPSKRPWCDMWELLLDQLPGVWGYEL